MKYKIILMSIFFDMYHQIDIMFNYEYINENLYDKKEFIKYVLEDWVTDRIDSFL